MTPEELVKIGASEALKPYNELMQKLLGRPAAELGGIWGDSLAVYRFKRRLRHLKRVQEMISDAGFEPQAVPLKLLVPILQNGSLEEDDTLQDKWAALLVNAAHDEGETLAIFVNILSQLSGRDARVLEIIAKLARSFSPMSLVSLGKIIEEIGAEFPITQDRLSEHVDNLSALGLIELVEADGGYRKREELEMEKIKYGLLPILGVRVQMLGYRFLAACQPPKKTT